MTKTFEEVKRPENGPLTELNNNMQEVFSQYRKMRQYADYLEYESKQKDERIQDFKNVLNEASNELSRLSHENASIKSQLQHQALPVVPECVAEIIEYAKNNKTSIRWFFTEAACVFSEAVDWYAGNIEGIVDDIYAERQCLLIDAFITGKYEVEKPQLFYLKNKMTNSYLCQYPSDKSYYHLVVGVEDGVSKLVTKFTQQEIDSMNTGSYEKIEVEE